MSAPIATIAAVLKPGVEGTKCKVRSASCFEGREVECFVLFMFVMIATRSRNDPLGLNQLSGLPNLNSTVVAESELFMNLQVLNNFSSLF